MSRTLKIVRGGRFAPAEVLEDWGRVHTVGLEVLTIKKSKSRLGLLCFQNEQIKHIKKRTKGWSQFCSFLGACRGSKFVVLKCEKPLNLMFLLDL